mmetsp:Transcript_3267/g.4309  ORF Transcript_3267/g.4309 Transcript_3267/m.4309 type:complete len:502 (-) Transcript_3267:178-1683(-)|eukprot:CAMPEP_0197302040 /NCGR_PEP_ID=MMETSP0890-20130614/50794_1 /TAXON_ID=44058 ORGANISM="Aureoumbra lagunensis, Strain CCMP1510" /NCGR_SAMPLE_ID=MMETSP0890 /ASSEMBLY_ACC=CAM_ASM_000533 /LENGTH=501 /DNA_ID=CAMNT_0042781523 /DNA_START=34 /DNA_END=1539 /DNA_ORIENTATION=-
MSATLLERSRKALEEMDDLEELAVEALSERVVGAKGKMERDLITSEVAREMSTIAVWFTNDILSRNNSMSPLEKEVSEMRKNIFGRFYGALKESREYHARYGIVADEENVNVRKKIEKKVGNIQFSGQEVWGKYLDLNAQHQLFCNLPKAIILDYAAYLRMMINREFAQHLNIFDDTNEFLKIKKSAQYAAYVQSVFEYLVDFWHRARPLEDLESQVFSSTENEESKTNIDLNQFDSPAALEALGLDRLKNALLARGLKSGGDLKTRAQRLFSIKNLKPNETIDPKLLQSVSSKNKKGLTARVSEHEQKVQHILQHLNPLLRATLRRAERKLIRTKEEMDQEFHDEAYGPPQPKKKKNNDIKEIDDDDPLLDLSGPLYNPKNIPLGWDGKPIPFWLYKLHGLDQSFVCEICGNHTYWGRRAFEQHFTEWRHAHGMRCLRIPNTKHFHGVTKMEDAIVLWEQLQEKSENERFNPARDEEYEDSDGNVLNRATFEDLARMGML